MKVLLPTIRDPGQIGGTTTHLDMLSRGLEQTGHTARVLYLGGALPARMGRLAVVYPAGGLNRVRRGWGMIYAATLRGALLAAATERELARAEAAGEAWEVLNAQEVYSVPWLRRVADRHGIPLVLTLHGYPLFESDSEGYTRASSFGRTYLMGAEMRALRSADAVVTVDTRLRDHVRRLVPEGADRTYSLMNFIDTSAFVPGEEGREELRAAWGIPEGRAVLFCPRRLVKKNGVVYPSLALAAMRPAERQGFLLVHAGEGGERPAIEEVVRSQGLDHEVRLLGGQGREAVAELYRLADVVLVPSVHSENVEEATSLAALEAMASGRPLIAGAVGGLAEMVSDGVNGLLVPAADPVSLAAAILRLAAAPDLGRRLAADAREYVVANHSHLTAAEAYADIYAKAAARLRTADGAEGPDSSGAPAAGGAAPVAGEPGLVGADVLGGVPAPAGQPALSPMLSGPRWPSLSVLGFRLDRVSLDEAAGWLVEVVAAPLATTTTAISFNPELVMRARRDPAAAEALLTADLAYPDGVGAVWAARRLGVRDLERVAGIELADAVLAGAVARGLPVYFLGAAAGVAAEAARCAQERHPGLRVAGSYHGYFGAGDEPAGVEAVRRSGAAVLLAALGAPWQEVFIRRHRADLGVAVALGVGGSFDVWAGNVRRAPEAVRRLGLEWLYRLAADPRRLRRQVALPRFAAAVLKGSPDDYGPGRTGGRSSRHVRTPDPDDASTAGRR